MLYVFMFHVYVNFELWDCSILPTGYPVLSMKIVLWNLLDKQGMHSLCFTHKDMVRLDCKQLEQQEAALRQFQSIISAKVKDMEGMNKNIP